MPHRSKAHPPARPVEAPCWRCWIESHHDTKLTASDRERLFTWMGLGAFETGGSSPL